MVKPYPAVQSGGIRAVAMATPGIESPFFSSCYGYNPYQSSKKAIKTS